MGSECLSTRSCTFSLTVMVVAPSNYLKLLTTEDVNLDVDQALPPLTESEDTAVKRANSAATSMTRAASSQPSQPDDKMEVVSSELKARSLYPCECKRSFF